jgi:hypothetical protein
MLPNSQNNSEQVKRMLYSKKVKAKDGLMDDNDDDDAKINAKKLRDLEEIFTRHSEIAFDGSVLTPSKLQEIKPTDAKQYKQYIYPFISRKMFTAPPNPNKSETKTSPHNINVCIFRIFDTLQGDPFLQFKLQKSSESKSLRFPIATVPTNANEDSAFKNAADKSVSRWFPELSDSDSIKWKGVYTDSVTDEIYVLYEEVYALDADSGPTSPTSIKDEWWWACVHEIMNRNKLLSFDIHSTVVDLFEHVPAIMFLYDAKTGYIIETPHVLYSGITEGSTLDEAIALGSIKLIDNTFLKGDAAGAAEEASEVDVNLRSIYGTQYYLYEYESVFRSACYDVQNNAKPTKRPDPRIFRHAVFLGNTITTAFDTDNTTTNASIADIRSYVNTSWCSNGYNSAHHGRYKLSKSNNILDPVFCVCNNERIVTLDHYKINSRSVPVKFDNNSGKDDAVDKYELL